MATRTSARPRGAAALATVGAVVGAVVLVGCSGSGEGQGSPTTGTTSPVTVTATTEAPTPTPSATEASALPPLPDAAKENTPEGAEAFIRYYFDVVNLLHREPQLGVLQEIIDPGCESCANAEETISYLVEQGARLDGDLYLIERLTRIGGGDPGVTRFDATWQGPGATVMTDTQEVLDEIPPAEFAGIMAAKWTGEKWVFYDSAVSDA